MAVYDLLAAHYDAVTGDSAGESAFIDNIVSRSRRRVVTLLEVACGTGSIIAPLARRYQVSGLDISPGMLAIAREKLPEKTPLYVADMSDFELGITFDVIICVYHGINHLLDFASWERFFGCAYSHLNEGGMLIFDMLTISDLKAMASIPEIVQQDDGSCLVIRVRPGNEIVFDWNVELFDDHDDHGRSPLKGVIRTASFPLDRIRKSLSERFSGVSTIESDGSLADDHGEDRTWFACTKHGIPVLRDPGHPRSAAGQPAAACPGRVAASYDRPARHADIAQALSRDSCLPGSYKAAIARLLAMASRRPETPSFR